MEVGYEGRWLLATSRRYNELILEKVKKMERKDNPLGLASSLSMGAGELDKNEKVKAARVYNISLLTQENLKDLDKPYPQHLMNILRYNELVNSQIMNLYQKGFTKEQILDKIVE